MNSLYEKKPINRPVGSLTPENDSIRLTRLKLRRVCLTGHTASYGDVPVTLSPDGRSPIAEAMEWVSRIFAVAVVMVLPGLAGQWLDKRWGTSFLALVGFGFGLTSGIIYLVKITSVPLGGKKNNGSKKTSGDGPGGE